MPVVKRFRSLGQIRFVQKTPETSEEIPVVERKTIHRFQASGEARKKRSDSKHRFSLRTPNGLWSRVVELTLNCGGLSPNESSDKASLNAICNKLLFYALEDQGIVEHVLSEYPEDNEIIKIRSWRRD